MSLSFLFIIGAVVILRFIRIFLASMARFCDCNVVSSIVIVLLIGVVSASSLIS